MTRTNRLGLPKKQRFNLYLTERELDALDRMAMADGLSIAEHARRAIDDYLVRNRMVGEARGAGAPATATEFAKENAT